MDVDNRSLCQLCLNNDYSNIITIFRQNW